MLVVSFLIKKLFLNLDQFQVRENIDKINAPALNPLTLTKFVKA